MQFLSIGITTCIVLVSDVTDCSRCKPRERHCIRLAFTLLMDGRRYTIFNNLLWRNWWGSVISSHLCMKVNERGIVHFLKNMWVLRLNHTIKVKLLTFYWWHTSEYRLKRINQLYFKPLTQKGGSRKPKPLCTYMSAWGVVASKWMAWS